MSSSAERRYTPVPVEARGGSGDAMKIGGYAAVHNRESQVLGGFVEVVAPGFFADSRSRGWPDVMARYNHDDNMLLGTVGGGTLSLMLDERGLEYEVVIPKARADVYELVVRGDVRKSSFAFRTFDDSWDVNEQGYPRRTLLRGQLVDVAPVNSPAYTDTTAGKRAKFVLDEVDQALTSLAEHVSVEVTEIRAMAEADELRRLFVRTETGLMHKPKQLSLVEARSQLNRHLA